MRSSRYALSVGLLLISALLISGCSSLPANSGVVNVVKNRAAQYATTGNQFYARGEYEQALKLFQLARDTNLSIDDREGAVTSYNSIGKALLALGNLDGAEASFKTSIDLSQQLDNPALEIESETNLAELYLGEQPAGGSDPTGTALTMLEAIAAKPVTAATRGAMAIAYHDLGTALARKADYVPALAYLQMALQINSDLKRSVETASNHYMIASIYSRQGNSPDALKQILLALEFDKKAENSGGIASDLAAAGDISEKSGGNAAAYGYFGRALEVYETAGIPSGVEPTLQRLIPLAKLLSRTEDLKGYEELLAKLKSASSPQERAK